MMSRETGFNGINDSSRMNTMTKNVVDLATYRIEKALRDNGFEVRCDKSNKVKILIKLSGNEE